jgi:hypothetical protein
VIGTVRKGARVAGKKKFVPGKRIWKEVKLGDWLFGGLDRLPMQFEKTVNSFGTGRR